MKEICETRFGAEEKYKLFPFELIVKPKGVENEAVLISPSLKVVAPVPVTISTVSVATSIAFILLFLESAT